MLKTFELSGNSFLLGLFTIEQIMLTRTAYHACAIGVQFESNSNAAT